MLAGAHPSRHVAARETGTAALTSAVLPRDPSPARAGPAGGELTPALWQRCLIGLCALAFVGATAWEVAGRRDDWPLSAFDMYSDLQGKTTSRTLLRGVSDQGEFELQSAQTAPIAGARLRHLNEKLESQPRRQAGFLRHVQANYEAQRAAEGWPVLQAIRSYTETWRIRPGLAGIEKPARKLSGSLYLPPITLLDRLEAERTGKAPPLPPHPRPDGDRVFEFAPESCESGCEDVSDANSSGAHAVRASGGAHLSQDVQLDAGTWYLFLRLRGTAGGADKLTVAIDGGKVSGKGGAGNFAHTLGTDAWVWASHEPGAVPLQITVNDAGTHPLTIDVPQGGIELDQVWFSRAQRELPIFNEPVQP
jgi:hypothetical protein